MELKIYLTNLGKYNEGELVGKWVDVLDSPDWTEELASIGVGDNTKYEEFFISDYETDIDGLKIPEYMSLVELDIIAGDINDIPEDAEEAFKAAVEYWGIDDAPSIISSGDYSFYEGVRDDEALGQELVDSGYIEVPDSLINYIDYEAIGSDYELDADGGYTKHGFICQ